MGGWHTHGDGKKSGDKGEDFSEQDRKISNQMGSDVYLGNPQGDFKHFTPGEMGTKSTKGTTYTEKGALK